MEPDGLHLPPVPRTPLKTHPNNNGQHLLTTPYVCWVFTGFLLSRIISSPVFHTGKLTPEWNSWVEVTLNGAGISDAPSFNYHTITSYHLWSVIRGGVPEASRTPYRKRGPQPVLPCPRELEGKPAGRDGSQAGCQRACPIGPEVPTSAQAWHHRSIHRGPGGAGRSRPGVPPYPRRAPSR